MNITIIAAVAADRAIGRRGDLAFHISADLKRFKALTTGHTVIMGRKTFESLPKGALPNRRNIAISRNPQASFPGAESAQSLESALELAAAAGETEVFIIGGGQIYASALPLADTLQLTLVEATAPDADTFFPEIAGSEWELTECDTTQTDPKSSLGFRFATYRRRQ